MHRNVPFSSRQLPLEFGTSRPPNPRHAADSGANRKSCALSPFQLTTPSPTDLCESPSISIDEGLSRRTSAASDDVSRAWSYGPRSRITPTPDLDYHHIKLETTIPQAFEHATSSPSSSRTFSFTMLSSPDSDLAPDDMRPKLEEVDDDADTLEMRKDGDADPIRSDAADCSTSVPVNVPRKRGRPRKHPLPVPGQTKVAKGRSKTGCITCRRRKKKCDESKPSCLNCQKNAVVCEGYPVKEIWKSGKQKLEDGQYSTCRLLPNLECFS